MALDLSQLRRLFGNNSGQRMTMSPPLLELSEEEDERLASPGFVDKSDVSITTPNLLPPDLPEPATSSTGIADSEIGRVNQARMRTGATPFTKMSDPGRHRVSFETEDGGGSGEFGFGFMGGMRPTFPGRSFPGLPEELKTPPSSFPGEHMAPGLLNTKFSRYPELQKAINEGGRAKYFAKYGEMPRGPVDERGEPLSPEAARDLQRLPEATEEELAITEPALARTRAGLSPFPLRGDLLQTDTTTADFTGTPAMDSGLIDQESITTQETVSEGPQIPEIPLFMKDAANQVQEQAGPELPEIPVNTMDTIARYVLANEGMETEAYDDRGVNADTKEEESKGWAIGTGQHLFYPPDGGPPIKVEEGMSFTEEELLASADREMKEVTVPGIIRLIPEGSWDTLPPEAQAQLVSVAWNYGLGSHTFLGKNHPDPEEAAMGDRLFTTALREGDWASVGDGIRDLAGDNADKDGYARNGKRRIAEGDAFDAAMAGGAALPGETAYANQTPTSGMLDSFRATLSDIEEQGIASGLIPTDRLAYLTTDERREKLGISLPPKEEGGSWSIPKDGRIQMQIPEGMPDETWDKLTDPSPHAAGIPLVSQAIALLDRINSETVPQGAFPSTAEVTQARKEEETLQRQLDLMRARGATQQEIDAVEADFHTERAGSKKQKQIDEYMALDGDVRAFVEGRWSPADAVDAAIEGVGEELVGEYGGDTSSLLEGIIGDTPPAATEAGATDEETTTEPTLTEADIAYNQTRRIDIEAQARREGLLDSTALGIPPTQPKRKGLLDDRLAIAQALAQLSAGVAQGGLFGDITDTGEVRGGLVNVMPGAIKTLRDAQTATTGEDIPDSNWGYGPAEEEQLFYIGPGGEITWVKDNEGNYVLKGTTKGNELAKGEKAKMGQALIHMGVPAAMLLTDYYATAFNEEGKMVVNGEPVEGIARWLQSATAFLKSQGNIEGANDLERKYQSAKHATGTLGEVFLRLTTGAAYNQQEYGNAMDLFWIKVNDNPESVKHKRKMLSQFGPMLEMMSGMDPGGEAYDSAIKNLKELRQMKAQLLEGARQGYYGEWTPEQLRAMELDVLTDDPTISQPELYENRKFGGEGK